MQKEEGNEEDRNYGLLSILKLFPFQILLHFFSTSRLKCEYTSPPSSSTSQQSITCRGIKGLKKKKKESQVQHRIACIFSLHENFPNPLFSEKHISAPLKTTNKSFVLFITTLIKMYPLSQTSWTLVKREMGHIFVNVIYKMIWIVCAF